jgi:hypothetical protein
VDLVGVVHKGKLGQHKCIKHAQGHVSPTVEGKACLPCLEAALVRVRENEGRVMWRACAQH